jgi:predicted dehydrogenase
VADVIVYDPDPTRRREAAASGLTAVDTFEHLTTSGAAALVIATPDFAHIEQALAGTRANMAVLIEKPVAAELAEATAASATLAHGPCLVGYVLRHNLAARRVRSLLDENAVGTPVSFQVMLGAYGTIGAAKSRFAVPEPDRLYRDYSHEWDYVRWFFGPIVRVFAHARVVEAVPHVERPNSVDALLFLESGLTGSAHIDYLGENRSITILGTDGIIVADLGRGRVEVRRNASELVQRYEYDELPGDALRRQAAHLLDVANGARPAVTFTDGVAALAVADALRESARIGAPATVATD